MLRFYRGRGHEDCSLAFLCKGRRFVRDGGRRGVDGVAG
jgi:hypothetical protein